MRHDIDEAIYFLFYKTHLVYRYDIARQSMLQ